MGRRSWALGALAAIAVLAAGTFAALATAGANDPAPPEAHLLVVPTTDAGKAALAAANTRVVARYEAFTLVEATGGDVADLEQAGASRRDDMRKVRIGSKTSDPASARRSLLDKTGAAVRTAGTGGAGLAVVQYVGPLKDKWIDAVRKTGVEIVSYMAQNGQLVSGDDDALSQLAQLTSQKRFIRAVTPYTAADKQLPGLDRTGQARVVVSTVAGDAGAKARAQVRAVSKNTSDDVTVANFTQQHVSLDGARLAGLAELGGVVAVEPAGVPKLLDERATTIVAGLLTPTFTPTLGSGYRQYLIDHGFSTNSPEVVDITDQGVDKGVVPVPAGSHPDFYRLGASTNPSRILYAHEATAADANARDCGGHGTNVASIAAGYNGSAGAANEDAQGFNYGLGVAPYARLGATKVFNCTTGAFDVQTSITALHNLAYAGGARISNNSWGAAVGGAYNAQSQEFDGIVRDAEPGVAGQQPFAEIVSAGNSGSGGNTTGAPGTAKNVITVGASENVRSIGATDGCGVPDTGANSARDIIDFSSRGPTDDGRIKPDIVAPGTHVSGAQPQTGADYDGSGTCNPQFPAGSTKYTLVSGTSQAAPEASGFAALLREWYKRTLGGGTAYPTPAMIKALMANTATNLVGGADGAGGTNSSVPTQTQGWGRINLGRVLDGTARQVRDQKTVFTATGTNSDTYYNIASASKLVRVTLAWTDAVGPTTGNAFVNDLDLQVTTGGQTYKGNVLAGGRSVVGGSSDPRDNLENVFLPAGVTGKIKVRVIAANIAGDGVPGNADTTDQDFALVVSDVGAPQATGAVLSAGERTFTRGGDGDSYIEPGEPFTVSQPLRNVGNATATGIHGTLTGSGVAVTTPSATWPNLAAQATGANTPPFRATVNSSQPCGAPVSLTINATSSGGPISIPFTVPTGHPGAVITRTSTDVPKAIPDNNAAGVTSIRPANSAGGTVSDLDITVGQITHTWDGDLIISITSPQGTTVILANRNGSSGDNFTNTVFDDEAATAITAGAAPFTGSFRPFQPLSAFDGQRIQGTWTLRVADVAASDTGTLSSWNTKTRGFDC